jgi:mannose-6-phosphate isomerase-like protein (cupin superfamily)
MFSGEVDSHAAGARRFGIHQNASNNRINRSARSRVGRFLSRPSRAPGYPVRSAAKEREMGESIQSTIIRLMDARRAIPTPEGGHSASLLRRGTLHVKLSQPVPPNEQAPHDQYELYLIVEGSGVLYHDGKRDRFEAGDVMVVGAGVEHRFEDFTPDLSVWVVFYGPIGGEFPQAKAEGNEE